MIFLIVTCASSYIKY